VVNFHSENALVKKAFVASSAVLTNYEVWTREVN